MASRCPDKRSASKSRVTLLIGIWLICEIQLSLARRLSSERTSLIVGPSLCGFAFNLLGVALAWRRLRSGGKEMLR